MARLVRIFLLSCLLLVPGIYARASHIFGGDLLYTNVSGNLYKFSLTLYGDCSADATLFGQLYNATPVIFIYDNNDNLLDSLVMRLNAGSGIEVSPVCPSQISQTSCNGGTLPGVKQFIYSDTITLAAQRFWRFKFEGRLGNSFGAGRSDNITNVFSGTTIQIEATLNNMLGQNSSPVYTTIPTPYYCINVQQQYNHGATDADGDSLVFSLVPAISRSTGISVNYVSPYSATSPMSTAAGNFIFNPLNGQITFTPDATQDALIVNRVSEYRGGVLIGTTEREMTFIVQNNCDGVPPVANVTSISGAVLTAGNINICVGQPSVSFNVGLTNTSGDVIDITPVNVPATAVLNVNNNHTTAPTVNFNWATGSLPVGHYTFYLTIKANHCPLFNTQTVAYTINVATEPTISVRQTTLTNCVRPATMEFTLRYGFAPRNVVIMQGGVVVKTIIDNNTSDSSVVIDSLPPGNYTAIVRSDLLCVDSQSFTIIDSGSLPVGPVSQSFCLGDPSLPVSIAPVISGASINWFNTDGSPLGGAPLVNTFSEGIYSWYFVEDYRVCTSGPVPFSATVHPPPHAEIQNIPQTVCYGDVIYLKATGGTEYTWTPESAIKKDTEGLYVEVLLPVTVVVRVKDEFGCIDTTSVTYSDIQQCCLFSFPNAFTPNNDGNNDGFRIVTYGNMRHYSLSIFNRWGQKIFFTADPKKPWDGTFGGEPCEIGTYFYYLDAECLTGPKQQQKGDITLIR